LYIDSQKIDNDHQGIGGQTNPNLFQKTVWNREKQQKGRDLFGHLLSTITAVQNKLKQKT